MESRDSMPKQQYDESSIVILEGLDAVRKRPGMYIGSTDSKGLHHLVWEIVDNAIDEALNGYGNEIAITLEKDGSVTVEDHGRGMPVGKHKSGVSTLQVIFTILHAGGKFTSHGGYTSAGGLHGVGASVVNALCTWCKVTVHDGKDIWSMTFEDGGSKIGKLEKVGKTNRTGSTVSFKPDPSIFKSVHFSYSTICERAQEDAFLLKGLKMIVRDKRKEEKEVIYQYEDGLKAFIDEVNQDHTPMHDSISFRGESNQIVVEGCFQYTDEYQENIFSFTNMVRTRDGGSHETGAKQAFTKVFETVKMAMAMTNAQMENDVIPKAKETLAKTKEENDESNGVQQHHVFGQHIAEAHQHPVAHSDGRHADFQDGHAVHPAGKESVQRLRKQRRGVDNVLGGGGKEGLVRVILAQAVKKRRRAVSPIHCNSCGGIGHIVSTEKISKPGKAVG